MHACGCLLNHWPADIFAWIVYLLEPCYGSLFSPDVHALRGGRVVWTVTKHLCVQKLWSFLRELQNGAF